MATTHSTHHGTRNDRPPALSLPPSWRGHIRTALAVLGYGSLVAGIVLAVALAVVTAAPVAASAAGLGGLLAVWIAGIAMVVASPILACRCVDAVRRVR